MKPKNIKEFKQLIERYESITLEEIRENQEDPLLLTGFGSSYSCKLCTNIQVFTDNCTGCVYHEIERTIYSCNFGKNEKTYQMISSAENANDLLKAFKARAGYMRQILTELKLD